MKLDVDAADRWLIRLRKALTKLPGGLSPQDRGLLEFFVVLEARSAWKEKNGCFSHALAVLAFSNGISLKPESLERALADLAGKESTHGKTAWARALKDADAIVGACQAELTLRVGLHATAAVRDNARPRLRLTLNEQKRQQDFGRMAKKAWAAANSLN